MDSSIILASVKV